MSESFYYDWKNMGSALRQELLKRGIASDDFRYIKDIVNTKIGMFSYEGLPKGLTSEILETAIMFTNCLCFWKLPGTGDWMLLRYLPQSDFNFYWKPDKVTLLALNGYQIAENVPYEEIILVRDNAMDIIPFIPISEYIAKIKKIEDDLFKMIDVACLPIVLTGSKKAANQLRTLASKLGQKDAFIVGDDTLVDSVKSFNINLPYAPESLYELKKQYKNECMASLGIYSVDEKRERVLTSEIATANDYTDFVYMNALMERERFVKELDEKGLHLTLVETYAKNFEQTVAEAKAMKEAEEGGEKDEQRSDRIDA